MFPSSPLGRSMKSGRDAMGSISACCAAGRSHDSSIAMRGAVEITAQGLVFFGERFALPFPQPKYDQVFLPDMGGAMENYGCVAWSDAFVYRSAPSYSERELRATVLLHEMAHMWFGDIVTMKWWEDLWLNEAFAEWACYWAAVNVTEFRDAWSSFLAAASWPAIPPIWRQRPPDPAAGRRCRRGGRKLRRDHLPQRRQCPEATLRLGRRGCLCRWSARVLCQTAWGNTRLADLMSELELASGRDLAGWTTGWLDTAGTDRLSWTRTAPAQWCFTRLVRTAACRAGTA
jgi:aminopeptidase N